MAKTIERESLARVAADTPLFKRLTLEEIAACLSLPGVYVRSYGKGELLYSMQASAHAIGFLFAGRAKVMKSDGAGRMLMSVLHVGDVFGAASLFHSEDRYAADILALTRVSAVLISEEAWIGMMRADFRIAENYMAYLTARIRFLSARIDGFVIPTVEERVLSLLRARAVDGVYRPETSLRAIGEALCISRTSLYRAFDALESAGKIQKDGRNIRLLQEEET